MRKTPDRNEVLEKRVDRLDKKPTLLIKEKDFCLLEEVAEHENECTRDSVSFTIRDGNFMQKDPERTLKILARLMSKNNSFTRTRALYALRKQWDNTPNELAYEFLARFRDHSDFEIRKAIAKAAHEFISITGFSFFESFLSDEKLGRIFAYHIVLFLDEIPLSEETYNWLKRFYELGFYSVLKGMAKFPNHKEEVVALYEKLIDEGGDDKLYNQLGYGILYLGDHCPKQAIEFFEKLIPKIVNEMTLSQGIFRLSAFQHKNPEYTDRIVHILIKIFAERQDEAGCDAAETLGRIHKQYPDSCTRYAPVIMSFSRDNPTKGDINIAIAFHKGYEEAEN